MIKRTDREDKDKVNAVCFESAGRESNCIRCPIIDLIDSFQTKDTAKGGLEVRLPCPPPRKKPYGSRINTWSQLSKEILKQD